MKLIRLTHGQFAMVDDADYGWLNQWKWAARQSRHGGPFYAVRSARNHGDKPGVSWIRMHRLVLGLTDTHVQCDHKNHDTLDNQRHNLREATNQQNSFNTRKRPRNTSGFKGVTFDKFTGNWKAQIEFSGINKHLGRFSTAEDAHAAYMAAAKEMQGDFACQ